MRTFFLIALCAAACTQNRRPDAQMHAAEVPSADGWKPLVGSVEEFKTRCIADRDAAKAKIAELKARQHDPIATLTLYDDANVLLDDAGGRAAIADNSHPDPEMRKAGQDCEQLIDKAGTELSLDKGVYAAIVAIDASRLDEESQHFVKRTLRDFRRAGVDRDEPTREKIRALNEELTKIGIDFAQNIRDDVRSITVSQEQLAGLPADYVKTHADGKITTNYPDYIPFMTYAKDGGAREKLWRVYRQRAYPKNLDVLKRMVARREDLARLLGYKTWAAYVTETRMIRTPEAASDFIEKISAEREPRMKADYAKLLARKQKDDPKATAVQPWEAGYYEERVKAEEYAFDSQSVRPYFEYSRVKKGVFDITGRMFGLTYRPAPGVRTWHPDVEAYDVYEGDTLRGRFYLDMHPRENKFKHAAKWTLVSGARGRRIPEAVLMCNFPRPSALMEHADVETFFHEFGHLIHHVLGGATRWASESGTRTERDFSEAPSQLLEEWTREVEPLQTFALHTETKEPIPATLVAQMRRADEFGRGLQVRQQMFYAATSLELYRRDASLLDSTLLVRELQERYTPYKYANDTYFQLSFGHLDGYSAAYYTYMWSLVIAKDLYTAFQKEGILDPRIAQRYRDAILKSGGSKDAAEMVRDFLGRDFGFEAYASWLNGTEAGSSMRAARAR